MAELNPTDEKIRDIVELYLGVNELHDPEQNKDIPQQYQPRYKLASQSPMISSPEIVKQVNPAKLEPGKMDCKNITYWYEI